MITEALGISKVGNGQWSGVSGPSGTSQAFKRYGSKWWVVSKCTVTTNVFQSWCVSRQAAFEKILSCIREDEK